MFISEGLSMALAHWEHYNQSAVDNVLFIFKSDAFCTWITNSKPSDVASFFAQIAVDLKSAMHFNNLDPNEAALIKAAVNEATGYSILN